MYILVLKNMLKLLEKIINIEKSQTGGKKSKHPNPHLLFEILSWGHSTDPFLCGERNHDLGAQKRSSSGSGWKAVIAKLAHGIALHLSAIRIHCISFYVHFHFIQSFITCVCGIA